MRIGFNSHFKLEGIEQLGRQEARVQLVLHDCFVQLVDTTFTRYV